MLILHGNGIVDESILTGESVPQVKESVTSWDSEETLDKNKHKSHYLNGGTELIQTYQSDEAPGKYGKVPEKGMICYVVKNGFGTKQGKLMWTILDTTGWATVESKEAYVFLFILLICALVASGYVLKIGLDDPEWNRYKLLLWCIIILTSVVPPELPMELSLAVNYSMIELMKKAVFITEPFRIPLAGNITVCCFDKTGTLTSNDLTIKGCAGVDKSSNEITPMD